MLRLLRAVAGSAAGSGAPESPAFVLGAGGGMISGSGGPLPAIVTCTAPSDAGGCCDATAPLVL